MPPSKFRMYHEHHEPLCLNKRTFGSRLPFSRAEAASKYLEDVRPPFDTEAMYTEMLETTACQVCNNLQSADCPF